MGPIERAARALAGPAYEDIAFEPERNPLWADHVRAARAVIAAIREPSGAMIDDAYASYDANGGSLRDVFMDMIDKMLEDGQ